MADHIEHWHRHWQCFLALESDLAATARYVEITADNYETYSVEYVRILLATGSEVDVVCKLLSGSRSAKMKEHQRLITPKYSRLFSTEVLVPRHGISIKPWETWNIPQTPDWWISYDKVKHHRDRSYAEANLKNALYAVAGLLVMTLYLRKDGNITDEYRRFPELFWLKKGPGYVATASDFELPDFPWKT